MRESKDIHRRNWLRWACWLEAGLLILVVASADAAEASPLLQGYNGPSDSCIKPISEARELSATSA